MTTERVDIATFEIRPVPNQMMMIGASAIMGIEPRIPERQTDHRPDHIPDKESEQGFQPRHIAITPQAAIARHLKQKARNRRWRPEHEGRRAVLRRHVVPKAEKCSKDADLGCKHNGARTKFLPAAPCDRRENRLGLVR